MNKQEIKELMKVLREENKFGRCGLIVKYANGKVEQYESRGYCLVLDNKKAYESDCVKLERKLINSLKNETKFPVSFELIF